MSAKYPHFTLRVRCILTISTDQLLPHLNGATSKRPLPDLGTEQLKHTNALRLLHDANCLLDFQVLGLNERAILISLRIDGSKNVETLLPALLSSKPARRFWEEHKSSEKNEAGDGLHTPGNAESCRARYTRATIGDQEHDEDSPFNCPLLNANDASADTSRCKLCKVHADLR